MAYNITLILTAPLGENLGPNFNITTNVGTPSPNTATKSQLLSGIIVSVDELTTFITVTSVGECTNQIIQAINCDGTTTTTTTVAPTTTTTTAGTTTTTTEATTTTTTLAIECNCYEVVVTSPQPEEGNAAAITYFSCEGGNENRVFATPGTYYQCAQVVGGLAQIEFIDGTGTISPIGNCLTEDCPPATTTTTTEATTTTTTEATTTTTTLATVYYVLERCDDANTFYSIGYPSGTFADRERVTAEAGGITYTFIVINVLNFNPGGGLLTITGTGESECPTTTTTTTEATTTTTTEAPGAICYSLTDFPVNIDGVDVRYRAVATGNVTTTPIDELIARDNGDGTYTWYICVQQGASYAIPVCVIGINEVTCPQAWIEGGSCTSDGQCDVEPTTTTTAATTTTTAATTTTTTEATTTTTTTEAPCNCVCYTTTYETLPEGLEVRWRNCETDTITTQDISTLLQRDNLDGTYTNFICVKQGSSYATPVCVFDGLEVTCDPLTWISNGPCCDSVDCDTPLLLCINVETNNSLDVSLTDIVVNGYSATPSGLWPNTPGNGASLTVPLPEGTYDVTIYHSCSVPGQRVSILDSNSFNQCQPISTGASSTTFFNVVMNNEQCLSVVAEDGACV